LFRASDLDPTQRFPGHLLGLFRGIWVDRRLSLVSLSPWGTDTRSGRGLFRGLGARIMGRNRDGRDRDIAFKSRDGRNKVVQVLHSRRLRCEILEKQ
jgi:hypothetical protein